MSAIYDPLIRCGTLVATKLNYGRISGGPYQRARSGGLDAIENHAPLALASGQPEDLPVYMYIWRSCPGIPLISIHCRRLPANSKNKMFLDPLLRVFSRPPSSSCPTRRRTR